MAWEVAWEVAWAAWVVWGVVCSNDKVFLASIGGSGYQPPEAGPSTFMVKCNACGILYGLAAK